MGNWPTQCVSIEECFFLSIFNSVFRAFLILPIPIRIIVSSSWFCRGNKIGHFADLSLEASRKGGKEKREFFLVLFF